MLALVAGNSLEAALRLVAPNGTVVMFGNSSRESTSISFSSFVGHEGARIQSFFSFKSGTPESYGKDLALLVSLIADGELHPQIGSEASWRELKRVMTALGERNVPGKAIFHID